MAKTVMREAGIVILLFAAIALILGIVFYDYIPNNKTLPTKVEAYRIPDDVQSELAESLDKLEQNIVRTYYIDSDDLSLYESTKDYNKGKVNPFAPTATTSTNTTSTGSTGSSSSSSTSSGSASTGSSTSTSGTGGSSSDTQANGQGSEYLNNKTGKY